MVLCPRDAAGRLQPIDAIRPRIKREMLHTETDSTRRNENYFVTLLSEQFYALCYIFECSKWLLFTIKQ